MSNERFEPAEWSAGFPGQRRPDPAAAKLVFRRLVALAGCAFLLAAVHGLLRDWRGMNARNARIDARTAVAMGTVSGAHDVVLGRSRMRTRKGQLNVVIEGRSITLPYIDDAAQDGKEVPVRYEPGNPDNRAISFSRVGVGDVVLGNLGFLVVGCWLLVMSRLEIGATRG